ncbi:MAG: hypothetical protein KAS23_02315, partial [Anaerohalosphaera sp.]|nr:hypothetical protein [Anaerohalosphaera sp.]
MKRSVLPVLIVLTVINCCYAITLYVSPAGNDSWSGKLAAPNTSATDGPKATIAGARDRIRKIKADGGLTESITVIIADGEYSQIDPVVFTPADSGTESSPITYRAAKGARPLI